MMRGETLLILGHRVIGQGQLCPPARGCHALRCLVISVIHGDFQMKFATWVCHENTQVEFEFGSGRIRFGRVMPLGLRNIPFIFSFRSLSPLQIDILNWKLVYRCVTRIRRLTLNLGSVK